MIELDHTFSTGKGLDYNWEAILDLDRIIPCVEGGTVLERTAEDSARAEIKVKMGAMSMTFAGTVSVAERDDAAHRAVFEVRSREQGGTGSANATVPIQLEGDGGTIHTEPRITGKAASMGEGVTASVLDALITDFTANLSAL